MALVTTVFEVVGVLAAMAMLLWFSAVLEARQLGPVLLGSEPEIDAGPASVAVAVEPVPVG